MIYKKGKAHRVLVCPKCGVLATNGLLKTLGAIGGAVFGGPAGGVAGYEAGGVAEGLFKKKEKPTPAGVMHRHDRSAYNKWLIESAEG